MCPFQRDTGSNCEGSLDGTDRSVDSIRTKYSSPDLASDASIIRIANKRIKLLAILKRYNLQITRANSYQKWSGAIKCPFPHHNGGNERTPSFGYNFDDDFFYCLGCKSYGHAVEFIALREQIDKIIVARQIIQDNGGYDFEEDIEEEMIDNSSINDILFEFSYFVSTLIQKHKRNSSVLHQIHKIMWWVDLYLAAKAPKKQIVVETLRARLSRAKELLEEIDK